MSSSSILHHSNNDHSVSFVYNDILIKSANPSVTTKLSAIVEAPKFKKWLDDFNKDEINFKEFYITDCDFFGPVAPNRLGFVKGEIFCCILDHFAIMNTFGTVILSN